VLVVLGLLSIWFDNGLHAAAAIGVITLLDAATRHSVDQHAASSHAAIERMRKRFFVPTHGIREVKSEISREILERFREHDIAFAPTATYVVTS